MGEAEFVFRGHLADTPLPEMLATIHKYGVPGVMEFVRGEFTKRVFFVDGDVIFATSSDRRESLGDFLLNEGKITRAQYDVSSAELRRTTGKRHGRILVEMGFIQASELGTAVREQVQMILWGLFNWEEAEVTFEVGRFRDDEVFKIKIPTPRAILSGCKRISNPKRLTARLGGRLAVFKKLPRPEHLLSLRLEPPEQQMLDLIDGRPTLVELCEKGPLNPGLNARLLYSFWVLGLVDSEEPGSGVIKIQVRDGRD